MPQTLRPRRQSRGRTITAWTLQVILAAAFLAAGLAKLAGVPMMVEVFDWIGVGQWLRIVTGLVEVAGGLALLTPAYAVFGATLLGTTMAFAVATHLVVLPTSPAPAAVLLVLSATVAWLRRDQFTAPASARR